MKEKEILFVIDSITCGGAERGLIALLNSLDFNMYHVDLLYFCQDNQYYKDAIPSQVNIIEPDITTQLALSSQNYVLKHLRDIQHWPLIVRRLWYGAMGKLNKKKYFSRRVKDWKHMKRFVSAIDKKYDTAIAYIENSPVYFTLDKVKADNYIVWQRTDYTLTGCVAERDLPYFERSNTICTLSQEMKDNFVKVFPSLSNKVIVFPNIIDVQKILEKSDEEIEFDNEYKGMCIISVGTLRRVKGYDVSMRACQRLMASGYDFRWYILGSGEEQEKMAKEIDRLGIRDHFILLGNKRNPYAYIKQGDIFVQSSYREGFSTTVFEAKCLQKPIVITDAPGMKSQIVHDENGLIVPIGDDEKLADAILRLLKSSELRDRLKNALKTHVLSCIDDTQEKLQLFDRITE